MPNGRQTHNTRRWGRRGEHERLLTLEINLRRSNGRRGSAVTEARAQQGNVGSSHPHHNGGRAGRSGSGLRRAARQMARAVALYLWRPVRDVWRTIRRRHPVRFFTFHRVTDACRDGMTVDPTLFRKQLEYVLRTHQVVTLEESLELLQNGTRLTRPVAVITFDDGYRSVYEQAFPIMTELGVAGSCFLTTGLVATEKRFLHDGANPAREKLSVMDWEEILQLCMMGWTLGGHSMTHARLSECDGKDARLEVEHPIELLRLTLGLDEIPWAFPFGGPEDFRPEDVKRVRELGYTACFSNHGGENVPPADPYDLKRIDIGGHHETLAWKMMAHGISLDAGRSMWDRMTSNGRQP